MCSHDDGGYDRRDHCDVVTMDEAPAIAVFTAIMLIAALEVYDWLHPVGANVADRRMCEYVMLIQAGLTAFLLIIY